MTAATHWPHLKSGTRADGRQARQDPALLRQQLSDWDLPVPQDMLAHDDAAKAQRLASDDMNQPSALGLSRARGHRLWSAQDRRQHRCRSHQQACLPWPASNGFEHRGTQQISRLGICRPGKRTPGPDEHRAGTSQHCLKHRLHAFRHTAFHACLACQPSVTVFENRSLPC